ncbi:uncharacterized protein LOC128237094 [Mya arenaria]|uniref:uncharacterized protein LOC128237094 n=1 Tax=Mya arenaria TaxID=6604 RepID=UPI0022E30C85|nr:uncharacterized protein LOC128237094 [Mya arenaria]
MRAEAISTVVFIIAGILPTCIDLSFGGPVPNGNSDNQSPCFLIDKEGNLQNRSLADTVAHVSREVEGARIGISMAKQMLKSQSILLSKQVGKIRRNVTGLAFQTGSNRFNISNSKITNFLQQDYQHVNDINEMFENILMNGLSKIHSAASSKISDIHIRLLSLQCDIKVGLLGVGRTVPDVKEAHFDSSNILQSCDSESACLLKSYAVLNDIDIYMVNMEQFYGNLVISMQNKIETALNESNSTNK